MPYCFNAVYSGKLQWVLVLHPPRLSNYCCCADTVFPCSRKSMLSKLLCNRQSNKHTLFMQLLVRCVEREVSQVQTSLSSSLISFITQLFLSFSMCATKCNTTNVFQERLGQYVPLFPYPPNILSHPLCECVFTWKQLNTLLISSVFGFQANFLTRNFNLQPQSVKKNDERYI